MWLVLYVILGWDEREQKYKIRESGVPRVRMVTSDSVTDIVESEEKAHENGSGTENGGAAGEKEQDDV